MTTDQMKKAKENVQEIIKLYNAEAEKMRKREGFVFVVSVNMIGWTERALAKFFGCKVEVTWDEACDLFDSAKKAG